MVRAQAATRMDSRRDGTAPVLRRQVHRTTEPSFGAFEDVPPDRRPRVKAEANDPTLDQLRDPGSETLPGYWINKEVFPRAVRAEADSMAVALYFMGRAPGCRRCGYVTGLRHAVPALQS